MIIICEPNEKQSILEKLSPENGSCTGCPVFTSCSKYTSCEEALDKGIQWIMETKISI